MFFKTVTNWRQLIKIPEFEACEFLKSDNKLPLLEKFLEQYKKRFPTINFSCPFKPGPFYVRNFTNVDGNSKELNLTLNNPKLDIHMDLPNGIYKHTFLAYTRNDPMVFRIEWHTEVRKRLAPEVF